jgi:predicted alpha/beta hydrolase family esterase
MVSGKMKNAVLVHGKPSRDEYFDPILLSMSNSHWLPWLQKQLLINGYNAQAPEMPDSYKPDYEVWRREFERFDIGVNTLLVGHSTGAGFLLRWLSENREVKVGKLILVAPYMGFGAKVPNNFFTFDLDENLADRTKGTIIFNSDDDKSYIHRSVNVLRHKLKGPIAKYREFHGYGHFIYEDMQTEKFPELLEVCLSN